MNYRGEENRLASAILLALVGLGSMPLMGQSDDSPRFGTLSGTVLAFDRDEPLDLARVVLVPRPSGVFPSSSGVSAQASGARSMLTTVTGEYEFDQVPPGSYRLYVRRIGYKQAIVDVDLGESDAFRVSVGLVVAPIRLAPVSVEAAPGNVYGSGVVAETEAKEWDRVSLERWRQDMNPESDVQVVTQDDVVDAVTLGGTDVLRALQKLPGVTTRDDWTAEMWVRGASWDHTRIYFDGVPLFNPVHAGGAVGAVNSDALSAVFLHPGGRSAGLGDGAAGVANMQSRTAGGDGGVHGTAALAMSHASVSLGKRWLDSRLGTFIGVRRSWFGSARSFVPNGDGPLVEIPHDFADVTGRLDLDLGGGRGLEISGLWQRDWMNEQFVGGLGDNRSAWGSMAARASLYLPVGRGTFTQSFGLSLYDANVLRETDETVLAAWDSIPTQVPTTNEFWYAAFDGKLTWPGNSGGRPSWSAGYQVSMRGVFYEGAPITPYSYPTYIHTPEVNGELAVMALWGEKWLRPLDALTLRAGVRVEVSSQVQNLRVPRIDPQIAARYTFSDRVSASFATGKRTQYVQALAPGGLRFGPQLAMAPVWLVAGDAFPAIESDVSTLGVEYWLGGEWLAAFTFYSRDASGLVVMDPSSGITDDDVFVSAKNEAEGLEVSLRRLVGRWTGSLNYTLGYSHLTTGGDFFPSPYDRRHTFNLTASGLITESLAGGALRSGMTGTAASGLPYTRIHPGTYDCTDFPPVCEPIVPNTVEAPNAERSGWYRRLDLFVEWTRAFNGWHLGAYAQIQNLTGVANATTYRVNADKCRLRSVSDVRCGGAEDEFVPGLRQYRAVGIRIAF